MILVITNAADVTADFFQDRLRDERVEFTRLNTEHLATAPLTFTTAADQLSSATFAIDGRPYAIADFRSVYYRRPVLPEVDPKVTPGVADWIQNETRRAWGGVLTSRTDLRWVNHPMAISSASYKPEQLTRAAARGLLVPDTVVTTVPDDAVRFCEKHSWRVVAKPIGHGEILEDDEALDRIVYTNLVSRSAAFELVSHCPTMFQKMVDKTFDVRATVVGSDVIAVALHSQEKPGSEIDCRRDNMDGLRYSLITLPPAVDAALVSLVRSYGLVFGAIDLALDKNDRFWFFELNPAGQWAWLEQEIGAPISDALIKCLR